MAARRRAQVSGPGDLALWALASAIQPGRAARPAAGAFVPAGRRKLAALRPPPVLVVSEGRDCLTGLQVNGPSPDGGCRAVRVSEVVRSDCARTREFHFMFHFTSIMGKLSWPGHAGLAPCR